VYLHNKPKLEVECAMKYYLQHLPDRLKADQKKCKYLNSLLLGHFFILVISILVARTNCLFDDAADITDDENENPNCAQINNSINSEFSIAGDDVSMDN
jgi:hypothetical protein